ncbi:Hypothetical_protein [Hexamita inflata]|uniref:Hypothetical_protein n=1 Tax=Hexamita inflata TaxID=28002 RepID=A0AA86RLI0_9EUKA|nr:Hypothetical protein HINF_LOCUS64421 [Hexamita inflata]
MSQFLVLFLYQFDIYIYISHFLETAQTDFIETFESKTQALARQCFDLIYISNWLNIAAHDRFANFLERILRKRYQARKVCKDNDNRLEDRTKPDISIVVNGVQIYLDIGITWDLDKYYALKEYIGTKRIKMVTRSKLFRSQSVRISPFIKSRENSWKNSELISRHFMKRLAT